MKIPTPDDYFIAIEADVGLTKEPFLLGLDEMQSFYLFESRCSSGCAVLPRRELGQEANTEAWPSLFGAENAERLTYTRSETRRMHQARETLKCPKPNEALTEDA